MKETHTILIPMMLPIHFRLIKKLLTMEGYKVDILDSMSHDVIATGVKYVNNDMCYPAQLAIGQLLDGAMNHGYDTHKIALLLTQTGGGCRASNYIALLRKALKRAGLEYIPVLSFNVVGLEDNPGFKLTKTLLKNAMFAIIYGDMIMNLKNQILPYALDKDEVSATVDRVCTELERQFEAGHGCTRKELRKNCPWILKEFAQIKTVSGQKKTKVGIVGEIYVKFAPLGNNNLEAFLEKEDCEVVVPGLMDFVLYTADAGIEDWYLYGTGHTKAVVSKFIVNYIVSLQNTVIDSYKNYPQFKPQTPFKHTKALSKKVIHEGTKMGEGWLLTAEMVELIESGCENIVCTQPFGCLPNHIVGRGMLRKIKELYPQANIVPIDYDASTSKVNQENRIKLMLASTKNISY